MYGTNNTAMSQLAATGAVGIGYNLLGGIVLIYAGAALIVVSRVLAYRAKMEAVRGLRASNGLR